MLTWLQRNTLTFPPLAKAMREPNGLLAAGGDLSADRLVQAYRHGCFPWFSEGQPILWWSPDPRTVLFPAELHVSRSLAKLLRQQRYEVTFDQDFAAVIQACAAPRSYADGTWITDAMQNAYLQLHQRGYAHSVEVWDQGTLVGGLDPWPSDTLPADSCKAPTVTFDPALSASSGAFPPASASAP